MPTADSHYSSWILRSLFRCCCCSCCCCCYFWRAILPCNGKYFANTPRTRAHVDDEVKRNWWASGKGLDLRMTGNEWREGPEGRQRQLMAAGILSLSPSHGNSPAEAGILKHFTQTVSAKNMHTTQNASWMGGKLRIGKGSFD